MAVRREPVIDECGGASRRRRQAHAFLIDRLTKLIKKRENESAAKTGFALTRLQRPVFIAARFYRLFYFPLPPCFSFSERPLWHGSSRKSTAEKLSRKTFIYLICNSSTAELFFIYSALVKAYVCTNFPFSR